MSTVAVEPTMQITKIKEHVGAEVTGIDLRRDIDADTWTRVYDALVDNVVLIIRGQHLTPAELEAAAKRFGELMEDQNRMYLVPGHPLISTLSNRHKDSQGKQAKVAKNATWHTDHTNQKQPPKFTMLYPVALPDRGGGTAVCNMRAAYEALPEDLKARITGMKTANTLISTARMGEGNPDIVREQQQAAAAPTIQPLVRTHPERGTKAIWFHKLKTECILGMEAQETQDFLDELLETAIRPEFAYVHEYTLGDLLIVDNRSAMHKAGFDFDHSQHRMLYRVLVRGDEPY
ncbi:MAG: TauD/TfdA family dioxygenase [Alphaproteobacteria bacterium]|nr:TauD/TfdA family dioxygenase [Alphaproteobacteria bacterium]